jgi:predicted solute-binding protein
MELGFVRWIIILTHIGDIARHVRDIAVDKQSRTAVVLLGVLFILWLHNIPPDWFYIQTT